MILQWIFRWSSHFLHSWWWNTRPIGSSCFSLHRHYCLVRDTCRFVPYLFLSYLASRLPWVLVTDSLNVPTYHNWNTLFGMNCIYLDLKCRMYPMVWYIWQIHGPFHHDLHNCPCYLCLLCAQYDDVLEIPTQNVLVYHIRWLQSLGSCCLIWSCISLGLWLGIHICYNLNWRKYIDVRASEDDEADSFFADAVLLFGSDFISFFHSLSIRWLWIVTLIPESFRDELRSRKHFRNLSHDSSSAWLKLKMPN